MFLFFQEQTKGHLEFSIHIFSRNLNSFSTIIFCTSLSDRPGDFLLRVNKRSLSSQYKFFRTFQKFRKNKCFRENENRLA